MSCAESANVLPEAALATAKPPRVNLSHGVEVPKVFQGSTNGHETRPTLLSQEIAKVGLVYPY